MKTKNNQNRVERMHGTCTMKKWTFFQPHSVLYNGFSYLCLVFSLIFGVAGRAGRPGRTRIGYFFDLFVVFVFVHFVFSHTMGFQASLSVGGVFAIPTLIGFFAGVNVHVSPHSALVGEPLAADQASRVVNVVVLGVSAHLQRQQELDWVWGYIYHWTFIRRNCSLCSFAWLP